MPKAKRGGARNPNPAVPPLKVPDEVLIDAITKARGLLSAAARACGISRNTVYERAKANPAVQEAIDEAREVVLDVAESSLYKQAAKGEGWAVKYLLSTQGRNRGYVERRELVGDGGGPLTVEVVRRVVQRGDPPEAE